MNESRHLHFNLIQGIWLVGFITFAVPPIKLLVKNSPSFMTPVKGLFAYTWGQL